jgi:Fe-Mn family superoxide dismutase
LQFSPIPKTKPTGLLAICIERDFGSFEAFREQFAKSALGLFGSGWTWLAANKADGKGNRGAKGGKLEIINTPDAGNPLTEGKQPLMVIDVWEHAYYIDHRNARAASVESFWNVFDWKIAEARFE